ncbi:hypothetical protein F5876DRAFT_67989 [Lentinula aff. lateritia]|uniref:Uncharacterized protein n=1 Tax=Lentinula aff. lateritia TaxID=2804960 RepID=A0ACC1TSI2_9AGAR|nr:hypothetical protein F5876DRAFT_67989 [Lentinula aff. lateritia]
MSFFYLPPMEQPVPLPRELSDLIPTDIYELIISFLNQDPVTLKFCSLTCRSWLWPSWKTLFQSRTIHIHRKNIDDFLKLIILNAHTLTIIRFIQHLHIEQGGSKRLPVSWQLPWGIQESGDYEIFQFDDFLHLFIGLMAVRTLKLGWIRCDTSKSTSDALRSNFGSVTTLDLDSVILSSSDHFFDILGAFPLLSSLSLTGVLFNGGRLYDGLDNWDELDARRTVLEYTPPPPSSLHELYTNVTEDVSEFLFSWMTYHDIPLPMRSLSTGLFSESSNAALSKFLFHSGSTLENIMIRDAHESTALDLSPCVNLRALEIGCVDLQSSSVDERELGSETFVTNILRTVTSDNVEYLKIVLAISGYEDAHVQIHAFDWRGLIAILERSQFKDILVEISVSGYETDVEQALSEYVLAASTAQRAALLAMFNVKKWTRIVRFFLAIFPIFTVVTIIHAFPTTSSVHGSTAPLPTVFRGRSFKNPRQDIDTCPHDILLTKASGVGRAQRFKATQKMRDVLLRAVVRDEGTRVVLADEHVSTSSTFHSHVEYEDVVL